MAAINNLRGMLLEEALLYLLRKSGYTTIDNAGTDPTLVNGRSGLEVKGRGEKHQIDAIADYKASPPFCNPQRLLVEGKMYDSNYPVGLPVIRNAVGVLKDINEFFYSSDIENEPSKNRYHYTYGIFSASGYRTSAVRYAYAHDIYLIPVAQSHFFRPVVNTIRSINADDLRNSGLKIQTLRNIVRENFRSDIETSISISEAELNYKLNEYIKECKKIGFAFIAIAGNSFPILLIPSPNFNLSELYSIDFYRIRYDQNGWYLEDGEERRLFSFDLPAELFKLFANEGVLTQQAALDLKESRLADFRIIVEQDNELKSIKMNLDREWIQTIRDLMNNSER